MRNQSKVITLATVGLLALGSAAFAQSSNNLPPVGSSPDQEHPVLNSGRTTPAAQGDMLFAARTNPASSFSAHLTGSQVNPPNKSPKAGNVLISLNPERTKLEFHLRAGLFDSPVQALRIRKGAIGSEGPVLKQFGINEVPQLSMNWTQVGDLTITQNPPTVTTETTTRTSADRSMSVTRQETTTTPGITSVIADILSLPVSQDLSFSWSRHDKDQPLLASVVDDLINGRLYIDVVTGAYPSGEIRGQITNANNNMTMQMVGPH